MNTDVKQRMADVWGTFVKRILSQQIRQERKGKHRGGHKAPADKRGKLLASRKRERQARRYARLCAAGLKHRA